MIRIAQLLLSALLLCVFSAPASAQSAAARADAAEFSRVPADGLDWTANPGAFERSLRRRTRNPLYPPARRYVGPAELRAAIVRDAGEARAVLDEFMDLATAQRRLRRLKDAGKIQEALQRFDLGIRRAAEAGGEAYRLAAELQTIRGTLLNHWRERNSDDASVQKALAEADRRIARRAALENNPFVAQLLRRDGPVAQEDLASALLSEEVATISLAMRVLDAERANAARREAPAALSYARLAGARIEGLDARVRALEGN